MNDTIVVAGGGIGGLAAALALGRRGHRVVVLERNAEFSELGAGIQLAPNGLHALDRLGVGDAVRAAATPMRELRFMDGVTGEHVTSLPLTGQYRRRFGRPYVVVHRADLHRQLLDACRAMPGIELRAGLPVTGYTQTGSSATVRLDGGGTVTGAAVIGADGIHSRIRRQLVADGEPRISGITVYRTVLSMAHVPAGIRRDAVTWWAGPKCHFVHYPIAGGRLLNMAASHDDGATTAVTGVPASTALVQERLAPLTGVHHLLGLGRDWRSWTLVDREPVDRWADGRVVLLGDAAHPMLHYAAQGACQALEDAVVLGELLEPGSGSVAECLETFNLQRRERTAAVQRVSRDSIRLWHPAGPEAAARNRMLKAMTAGQLHDAVAWMHGVREFGAQRSGAAR
ncbi:FAD-dependent monooxygenase [Actinoplanes sp. NPDC051494]|uniref:FAD-dependent monooxygenase n=1 Tax=Actinoplanes sp. NPDC051494 TaxID=3363907 RepID=UPI003789A12A